MKMIDFHESTEDRFISYSIKVEATQSRSSNGILSLLDVFVMDHGWPFLQMTLIAVKVRIVRLPDGHWVEPVKIGFCDTFLTDASEGSLYRYTLEDDRPEKSDGSESNAECPTNRVESLISLPTWRLERRVRWRWGRWSAGQRWWEEWNRNSRIWRSLWRYWSCRREFCNSGNWRLGESQKR